MGNERILIVEDQKDLQELLRYNFKKEGYQTLIADSGREAESQARIESPSLIVLDLTLPDIDGLTVCKSLRSWPATRTTPIIILTARGEEADIVRGLEAGADDYVTKPFSPKVLMARVRAALRRADQPNDEQAPIRISDLWLHPGRFEVRFCGQGIELTRTQFRILHFLMRRPGWAFTRFQIVDGIEQSYDVTERSVDVQIVGLRKRLGKASRLIETVRGVGYRFKDD